LDFWFENKPSGSPAAECASHSFEKLKNLFRLVDLASKWRFTSDAIQPKNVKKVFWSHLLVVFFVKEGLPDYIGETYQNGGKCTK
jgi:hypothetical protein